MPYAMPPVQTRRAKNSSAPPSRRRLSGDHAPWRQPWEIQQGFFRNIEKHTQKLTKTQKHIHVLKTSNIYQTQMEAKEIIRNHMISVQCNMLLIGNLLKSQ